MIETVDYKEKDYVCDKCHWYAMIDSGYGYCRRFPPTCLIKVKDEYRKRFFIFPYYCEDYQYPVVAWTTIPCGEFKETIPKNKGAK